MPFESPQGDVEFNFPLDFSAEHIQFDLFRDIGVATVALHRPSASTRSNALGKICFGNGQLHIVHADTGELIGRKGSYLPMNP
jgi:hypothetical protein